MLTGALLSLALMSGVQEDVNVAIAELAAVDGCVVAQAARFERLESRILDAASLVTTVGCKSEIAAYLDALGLPSSPQAFMGGVSSGTDPSAFQTSIIKSQELLEKATIAIIDARERRLTASSN